MPSASEPQSTHGRDLRNQILLSLKGSECASLLSKMTLVELKLNDVMQKSGEAIKFLYFPNTAMASVLNTMADGKTIEVALVGNEGIVGLPVVAGFKTSSHRVVVQGGGSGFRMAVEPFLSALKECPEFQSALWRYSQVLIMQTTQIAGCNRLHEVDRRLARWLLMTRDRVETDLLPLTQEFLSQMLGIRRASVSVSASILQRAGLIRYTHGKIRILNRKGLEQAACECYGNMRQQLEIWNKETRKLRR